MTETSASSGTFTWNLTDLKQGPPDPALFELPAGYDLHEIRTRGSISDQNEVLAATGPDTARLPAMSYADALAELGDPMRRQTAAAVLMKMAEADKGPVEKDKIAYAVTRLNLQLAAAEGLEQAVVTGASSNWLHCRRHCRCRAGRRWRSMSWRGTGIRWAAFRNGRETQACGICRRRRGSIRWPAMAAIWGNRMKAQATCRRR
ncbi:MAG TPA: hypothetical protein VME18_02330 [Acidobacteriaceae bacterium]|nr:hypothetical protein [Acidobacteriaceae bacterium]